MSLSIGIVGLPNVGKSTLFNALLKQQAALAANYPFATIEPNVGVVPVPDDRLSVLAGIVKTSVMKPATVEFVDIAGLVKGASTGEGLGNQFLHHIRETSAVCHVIRVFEDEDIIREGSSNPQNDLEVIRTELQLADLATLDKQIEPKGRADKDAKERWEVILQFRKILEAGNPVSQFILQSLSSDQVLVERVAKELALLTAKPELFVINVSENELKKGPQQLAKKYASLLHLPPASVIVMCNQIESELSSLCDQDQKLYLRDLGLEKSGLERLITSAYATLGLQSFLTAGEKEVRAWTIKKGTLAPQAAGVIHSDFEKKFIAAKVASFKDFVVHQGWKGLKVVGKIRQEGRDYEIQEGDVVEFMTGS